MWGDSTNSLFRRTYYIQGEASIEKMGGQWKDWMVLSPESNKKAIALPVSPCLRFEEGNME